MRRQWVTCTSSLHTSEYHSTALPATAASSCSVSLANTTRLAGHSLEVEVEGVEVEVEERVRENSKDLLFLWSRQVFHILNN